MAGPTRRDRRLEGRPTGPDPVLVLAGRILRGDRLEPAEIGIDEAGVITEVGRSVAGARRKDYGEAVILPAATDLHVHFRDPGGPDEVEGFESGTRQAALGGVGLVGDMPNTEPPVTDLDRLETKEARANRRISVDVFLYASAGEPRSIARLATRAAAFKLYLAPTTGIARPPEREEIGPRLEAVAATGLPLTVHAEAEDRFSRDPAAHPADTAEWNRARPVPSEVEAVNRTLAAAPLGLRLHFAHLTARASAVRARGAGVSAEATPHHLLLSARVGGSAYEKVNPPLRPPAEQRELWAMFARGEIPMLASDHAPHSEARKSAPFERAPSGMPGVETMLPLLLAKVRAGALGLPVLVRAACDRPARWVGAPIGRVAPGHRAHLIVVDFRRRAPLRARDLDAPCGWTPFEKWEAIRPIAHYRAGQPIVVDGEFVGDRRASIVRPEFAPSRRTRRAAAQSN